MPEITKGVYFIPGQDEFIPDSHVYVIGMPDSRDFSIVDAGLMGKGSFEGDLDPFLPYLFIGEYLHAGKGASWGFGRYRLG